MKNLLFVLLWWVFPVALAQGLPDAVAKSFDIRFPDQVITSWTENHYYDFEEDWNEDIYYGDSDYDGYVDTEYEKMLGFHPTRSYGYQYTVPMDYQSKPFINPAYYQLYFTDNGVNTTAIFKPDGTFVIAKSRIHNIPENITSIVLGQFKGKTVKLGNNDEKIIVPNSVDPVYRVKVEVKHGKTHILKVDADGAVISDNIR